MIEMLCNELTKPCCSLAAASIGVTVAAATAGGDVIDDVTAQQHTENHNNYPHHADARRPDMPVIRAQLADVCRHGATHRRRNEFPRCYRTDRTRQSRQASPIHSNDSHWQALCRAAAL